MAILTIRLVLRREGNWEVLIVTSYRRMNLYYRLLCTIDSVRYIALIELEIM